MQPRTNRALWLALIAVITSSLAYLLVVRVFGRIPAASGFFGHILGVLGFVMMLMTETLYSLRKRSRTASWGRVSDWLNFHIFTGITGPYLVLLHTSWRFNGLAGLLTLLSLVVVLSGFIGRYIYTALPRSADGAEMDAKQAQEQINALQAEIARHLKAQPALIPLSLEMFQLQRTGTLEFFGDWQQQRRWRHIKRRITHDLEPQALSELKEWELLTSRQRTLNRQVASLARARRLLSLWHSIHIPIGMVLFAVAFVHIGAALYYATLLR